MIKLLKSAPRWPVLFILLAVLLPWEHEAHKIYISVDHPNHEDSIRVKRDGEMVDISVLESEGFEMMSVVHDPFHNTTTGIFKRFVEGEVQA